MNLNYQEILKFLQDKVQGDQEKEYRLEHSVQVMKMALYLNELHDLNLNEDKIRIAALLHDYGKLVTEEEVASLIENTEFQFEEDILLAKDVHHAIIAPFLIAKDLGIYDCDIATAAMFHCTGREQMSPLTELIFISDYTELGRKYQNCIDVREIAYQDLKLAIFEALDRMLACLKDKDGVICNSTIKAHQYYKRYSIKE
jgi:predicted HD superfamily hydrolase involved in NAD metabolism